MRRFHERESEFMQNMLCLTARMIEPWLLRLRAVDTLLNSIAGTALKFVGRRRSGASVTGQIETEFRKAAIRARP